MSVPLSGAAVAAGTAAEVASVFFFLFFCAIALRLERAKYTVGWTTGHVAVEFCKELFVSDLTR